MIDQVERIHTPIHSEGQIREFVLKKYGWVADNAGRMAEPERTEVACDLCQIHEKMFALGWVKSEKNPFRPSHSARQVSSVELQAWKKGSWDGKVIRAGVVKAGAGFYLDQFTRQKDLARDPYFTDNLESLLKHVETRREKCQTTFDPLMDNKNSWLERLNICLLFIRAARCKEDPRFLNAALKMSDWYFSYFQSHATPLELSRFLLVLVEQEATFQELYP